MSLEYAGARCRAVPSMSPRDSACSSRPPSFGAQEPRRASKRFLHRDCRRQVHALLNESALACQYATVETLLQHSELRTFVAYVHVFAGSSSDADLI